MDLNAKGWGRRAAHSLLAIGLAVLTGCTNRYYFEDFRAQYAAPEMPTQFASAGGKGLLLSGGFAWGKEGRIMDVGRQDTAWLVYGGKGAYFDRPSASDTTALAHEVLLQERYRFERQPASANLDLVYRRAHWFAGAAAGAGIPDPRCFFLGVFGGYSQLLLGGRLAPTIGGGFYLNRFRAGGRYWNTESSILAPGNDQVGPGYVSPPPTFHKDSAHIASTDFELPVKMGLMYRWSDAFEPYVLAMANSLNFWPEETEEPARYSMDDVGLALGIRNESIPGMALSLELRLNEAEGPMENITEGPAVAFRIQRRM
jgi:hypothetical protein